MIENAWIDFLKFCLDKECPIPESVSSIDWDAFLEFSQKQSIVGVLFEGISRLGYKPAFIPRKVLISWGVMDDAIQKQNKKVNEAVVKLSERLQKVGFDCSLLKGQGNNLLYPSPYSRMPGDIDMWITPKDKTLTDKQREQTCIQFLRKKFPAGNLHYNHVDAGHFNGVKVELHHRPRFVNNLVYNKRLQNWLSLHREEQFQHFVSLPDDAGTIAVPTVEFNVVFQLAHIYGHFIQEGIGLRHIVDYYYVLKAFQGADKESVRKTLEHLGLMNVSGAVSWILHHVLGMDADMLITPQDAVRGQMMWKEIMQGGNFGHYHEDNMSEHNKIYLNLRRLKRDLSLLRYYPSECLSEPLFRLYHFFWRLKYNN